MAVWQENKGTKNRNESMKSIHHAMQNQNISFGCNFHLAYFKSHRTPMLHQRILMILIKKIVCKSSELTYETLCISAYGCNFYNVQKYNFYHSSQANF